MDFEEYYQKFEAEAKKLLSAELWDKAVVKSDPKEFAKDLFGSDAFDEPDAAAEEFAEMVQEMDKEGAFGESKCEGDHECKWHVEYELIDGGKEDETFDDETEAWSRFNELDARTKGGLADVLWVKEPACPTCECGSSAASLGAVPTAGLKEKDEATRGKIDDFLHNALDYATFGDDETITVKFIADGVGGFELRALMPNGENKLLNSGTLFGVVDYYHDLVDMPDAEAITLIEEA